MGKYGEFVVYDDSAMYFSPACLISSIIKLIRMRKRKCDLLNNISFDWYHLRGRESVLKCIQQKKGNLI